MTQHATKLTYTWVPSIRLHLVEQHQLEQECSGNRPAAIQEVWFG